MIDVRQYLPAKTKTTPSGWISFSAPCCIHNGESADTKGRGGLVVTDDGWVYNCFNCGYKCGLKYGHTLGFKAKSFLEWLGVDPTDINRINLESLKLRSAMDILDDPKYKSNAEDAIHFDSVDLPDKLQFINSRHELHYSYLKTRCIDTSYPLLAIDSQEYKRDGILIPFTHSGKTVGYTIRFLDDRKPRYLSDSQPGYVFGIDIQKDDWDYCVVTEGIFDALSIDGLALMHATISEKQIQLIKTLKRNIIVVPDQDKRGLALVEKAMELGWSVSIPFDWPDGCKDINDAVKRMGKAATMISIMQNVEHSRIKIELNRKKLQKKVGN